MAATMKPQAQEADEPKFEWVQRDGCDTLLVHLPGYLKENLKVQVTSLRNLRVLGEKKISERKSSRFMKELSLPVDCDVNGITAKFEGGVLQVRLPKMAGAPAKQGVKHSASADKEAEREKTRDKADEPLTKTHKSVQDGKQAKEAESGKMDEKGQGRESGGDKNATEEKYRKISKWKLGKKKVTLLSVLILAVAVALGLGMLGSKGSIHQIIRDGWKAKRNPHQM